MNWKEASLQPFHSSHRPACLPHPPTHISRWSEAMRKAGESSLDESESDDEGTQRQWCVILCLLHSVLRCFSGFLPYKSAWIFIKYTWLYNLILIPTLKARCRAHWYVAVPAFMPQPIKIKTLHLSELSENKVSPFFYHWFLSMGEECSD